MYDNVNSPKHYVGKDGMEVIDVIDAFDLDLYQGSIVQYIIRYKHKNGIEDVRKAYWYIERLLSRLEKQNGMAVSDTGRDQSNYSTRLHPIDRGMGGVSGVYLREEGLRVGEAGGSCACYEGYKRNSSVRCSYPHCCVEESGSTTEEGS